MQKNIKAKPVNNVASRLELLVKNTSGLISLPEIYLKIRRLMNEETSVLDDFAIVVNGDANLAARVLTIVNSSFYGFPGQISSISRALNFIGISQLHDLVLSISAIKSLSLPTTVIDMHKFWQRSIFSGVFAKSFAEELKLRDCESFFVIGLLHEIGHLILALDDPHKFQELQNLASEKNQSLYQIEFDYFGFHYGQVGKALMKEWNLPANFQEITEHHPDFLTSQQFVIETAILHIAHHYALAAENQEQAEQIRLQIEPSAWQTLGTNAENIDFMANEAKQWAKEMEQMVLS